MRMVKNNVFKILVLIFQAVQMTVGVGRSVSTMLEAILGYVTIRLRYQNISHGHENVVKRPSVPNRTK
jgi:hypothetical protein